MEQIKGYWPGKSVDEVVIHPLLPCEEQGRRKCFDSGGTDEGGAVAIHNEAVARLLAVAGIVCDAATRRHRHPQPRADGAGGWGTQPPDGDVAGQAWRRVVGAEIGGRRLSMPRGHLDAP